jgi:hypothetical protein
MHNPISNIILLIFVGEMWCHCISILSFEKRWRKHIHFISYEVKFRLCLFSCRKGGEYVITNKLYELKEAI